MPLQLSTGSVGTYQVALSVGGKGLARKSSVSTSLSFTINGSISSISPISGFDTGTKKFTFHRINLVTDTASMLFRWITGHCRGIWIFKKHNCQI